MIFFHNALCPVCLKDLSKNPWVLGGHIRGNMAFHLREMFAAACCEEHLNQIKDVLNKDPRRDISQDEGYLGQWRPEFGVAYHTKGDVVTRIL